MAVNADFVAIFDTNTLPTEDDAADFYQGIGASRLGNGVVLGTGATGLAPFVSSGELDSDTLFSQKPSPITLNPGAVVVQGRYARWDTTTQLSLSDGGVTYRYDTICAEIDFVANTAKLVVVEGTTTPPTLTQNATKWQHPLFWIQVSDSSSPATWSASGYGEPPTLGVGVETWVCPNRAQKAYADQLDTMVGVFYGGQADLTSTLATYADVLGVELPDGWAKMDVIIDVTVQFGIDASLDHYCLFKCTFTDDGGGTVPAANGYGGSIAITNWRGSLSPVAVPYSQYVYGATDDVIIQPWKQEINSRGEIASTLFKITAIRTA